MKNVIIIQFIILLLSSVAMAQDNRLDKSAVIGENVFVGVDHQISEKVAEFFNELKDNGPDKAFNKFLKNSPIIERKDQLQALIVQTKRAVKLYGDFLGYEPVNSEVISESFVRVRYIGKHSKYPMRWIFTFYKSPKRGWIIINIKFDDLSEYFFSDE